MTPLNNRSTANTPLGARACRAKQQITRNRQLYDIIQLAALYHREGLLCNIDPADKSYHESAAKELAIVAGTTVHGAKKVLNMLGIRRIENAWQYLKRSTMFCIFEEAHFTKHYTSIKNGGGALCTDFLEAFANGDELCRDEKAPKRRKIDVIALRYEQSARDELVTMFLKSVGVVASLCSFMCSPDLDKDNISDLVQRYLSESWTAPSRQKRYNDQASKADKKSHKIYLADGWHMINELFKVQAQELIYWKEKGMKLTEGSKDKSDKVYVTLDDVKLNRERVCHHVISEFFAWCYHLLLGKEKVSSFIEGLLDVVDLMHNRLRRELDITGEQDFPENLLQSTLEDLLDGGPTLAEIRYSAACMVPSKRSARSTRKITWNREKVLMRCRWGDSSVKKVYDSFLGNDDGDELPEAEEEVVDAFTTEDNSGLSDAVSEEYVPGTPNPEPATPNAVKRGFREVSDTDPATPAHIKEQRKRLKVSARDNAFRLRHNPAAERSRLQIATQIQSFYVKDAEVSDDDTVPTGNCPVDLPPETMRGENDDRSLLANMNIQEFYRFAVDAPIVPVTQEQRQHVRGKKLIDRMTMCDLLTGNEEWFDYYHRSKGPQLLPDVTDARNIEMYKEHWSSLLPIEVRGMLVEEIGTLLPTLKDNCSAKWVTDIPQEKFVTVVVDKVSPSRGLLDVTCKAAGRGITKRVAAELSGGTLCVAYTYSRHYNVYTDLMIVACRRLSCDDEEVPIPQGQEDYIEEFELHLVLSRERTRRWGVYEGDAIHLFQLCAFSPFLRMFRSIEDSYRLPRKVANILCGPSCELPLTDDTEIGRRIDTGCSSYLQHVKNAGTLNDSQERAMKSVLGNIGSCEAKSSSISMIQGPPGTGKTTMVSVLIGALMNHSSAGHVNHPQVNMLKDFSEPDGLLRCSTNPSGLKILVCSPSNQGVDNILQRIAEKGIPDGSGGVLRPQSVRLARARYNYGKLEMFSVDEKALPFDKHKFYRGEERKHASAKAQKAFGTECLVVYTTLSTSGSGRLKKLATHFDIVIIDEAAQTLEPESTIPVTTIMRRTTHERCHVIFIGDDAQLRGISRGLNMVKTVNMNGKIRYEDQMISLFQRLRTRNRTSCNMLLQQYRMHPCIAEMHSMIFYRGKVKSPLPASVFRDRFNDGWKPEVGGFAPFTLIDTSQIPDRYEMNDQKGSVTNCVELNLIDETLHEIKVLTGDQFHNLRGQIAVIIPYAAQVERAKRVLNAYGKYMENGVSRQGFDILIGTLDSMQGAERDIIIFASTRSNRQEEFGFLKVVNRLNVGVSRARKLLIVIADMSTMKRNNEFTRMWAYSLSARNGANLLQKIVPINGRATGASQLVVDKNHVCE